MSPSLRMQGGIYSRTPLTSLPLLAGPFRLTLRDVFCDVVLPWSLNPASRPPSEGRYLRHGRLHD